jgi:hypothetical protein
MNISIFQNQPMLIAFMLWELVWKGLALWKAARLNEKYWFIALLFINTVGVFPIVYLIVKRNKK